MQLSDFNFDLPDELIARYPLDTRSASRLLHLDAQGQHHDFQFTDILDLLDAGDLLVLNAVSYTHLTLPTILLV